MPYEPAELIRLGVPAEAAARLAAALNATVSGEALPDRWRRLTRDLLAPELPFAVHRLVHEREFAAWPVAERGPAPVWFPAPETVARANITRLQRLAGQASYAELYAWSVREPAAFWELALAQLALPWATPPRTVLDLSAGVESPTWLAGARLNAAAACLQGDPLRVALVWQDEGGPLRQWTLGELAALTGRIAAGLAARGIRPGDAVALDLPMTPEAVALYLAIVASGAVVVSIADSFAPHEIAVRLQLTGSKLLFTQDAIVRGGKRLPLYAKVLAADPPLTVVLPSPGEATPLRPGDLPWAEFLPATGALPEVPCDPAAATNILFSSGTTGEPKCIPWDHTTPLKAALDAWLHHDIQPGDRLCWPTNLGWMMGPWLVYAALLNRATIALYTGAPTGRDFGQFVQDARVTLLGLVPSLVKSWLHSGCMAGLSWRGLRAFSSTGECSNERDMHALMALAGYRPVIEYCGGTEVGGGYITGSLVQPAVPGAFATPALGSRFVVLDEHGRETTQGECFLVPPALGLSRRLVHRDHHAVYYADTPPGPAGELLRRHGDEVLCLPGGYYRVRGRVDDTMNLGGIKVASASLEEVLNQVPGIRETAAIASNPPDGGPSLLIVYAVLQPDAAANHDALLAACREALKTRLNPLFRLHELVVVPALPRTASNKVMRRELRRAYEQARKPAP
jgi:acetyl-CoA synthetase